MNEPTTNPTETRALNALRWAWQREHGYRPEPSKEQLLTWAAQKSDRQLLAVRNFGAISLLWLRGGGVYQEPPHTHTYIHAGLVEVQ